MGELALKIYSSLMWLLIPVVRMKLLRRATVEPLYGDRVEERFGVYASPKPTVAADQPCVWLHAVSLGETRAAGILIAQLRMQLPGMRLVLTHSTATGWAQGTALLRTGDAQAWFPWDTAAACQRFLAHYQPSLGVLMETEVWPQMCAQARATGVPLVLANARCNEASLRKAQQLAFLARPAYASLAMVLAQTPQDAERLRLLGCTVHAVLGNLKFDAQRNQALWEQGRSWREALARPVVMLAASREGEEAQFLEAISAVVKEKYNYAAPKNIAKLNSKILWLIVPRHPQRFDDVARLLATTSLQVAKRSGFSHSPTVDSLQADVWLGDSMGEMDLYYGLADIALLGGSFAPLGGQNLIEAIACECPVIMGPHTFNFDEAARTAHGQGAAQRFEDMPAAVDGALELLQQNMKIQSMRDTGRTWLAQSTGVAQATAQAIAQRVQPKQKN